MKLIIDAYNLIKQILNADRVDDRQVNQIITILVKYARKKQLLIDIIFDGGMVSWLSKEKKENVTIIYVGFGRSADEYIKTYLQLHQNEDLLLVSSDHELNVWASMYHICSIGVHDFWSLVQRAMAKSTTTIASHGPLIKTTNTQDSELDQLMAMSNDDLFMKKNEAVIEPEKQKKLSKTDMLLLQKLKKL